MRPFKSGEVCRNRFTAEIGRTTGPVAPCSDDQCDCGGAPDAIMVEWADGSTLPVHVDALEHIQLFVDGRIIRNGMARFEVVGFSGEHSSLDDAIRALKESLDAADDSV